MQIGVFCPKALGTPKSVDVLVYAHGHLDPCPPVPQTMPDDLITKKPFELGKLVDASNRAIVLVVPFLDWGHLTANNLNFEACFRKNMHALGTPAKLNGVVREVLGRSRASLWDCHAHASEADSGGSFASVRFPRSSRDGARGS
jgi:hypothetical protein